MADHVAAVRRNMTLLVHYGSDVTEIEFINVAPEIRIYSTDLSVLNPLGSPQIKRGSGCVWTRKVILTIIQTPTVPGDYVVVVGPKTKFTVNYSLTTFPFNIWTTSAEFEIPVLGDEANWKKYIIIIMISLSCREGSLVCPIYPRE
ncbi:hypothetical protein DFA_03447 [Cavenderia fasciculata]|uniref:Uncharacterized protein n=1 Tax=Cavenderia fasciculata TaxID=261658 RepID=F4PHL5_CACFS|nr:uncharacterized protein DFA_03447 [Cavenderia fasciculata]EGG25199.1 hypothetical protein DFA_03447 [Cavenderia fasciculata]|eukprot:XP_004363050.1 hypothetical protein DFA_03447 [Cavenderia fasciculata]